MNELFTVIADHIRVRRLLADLDHRARTEDVHAEQLGRREGIDEQCGLSPQRYGFSAGVRYARREIAKAFGITLED